MREIAKAIQEGALAYLKRQFRTIAFILIPLLVVVFLTSVAVKKADGTRGPRASPSRASSGPGPSCSGASCPASPGSSG